MLNHPYATPCRPQGSSGRAQHAQRALLDLDMPGPTSSAGDEEEAGTSREALEEEGLRAGTSAIYGIPRHEWLRLTVNLFMSGSLVGVDVGLVSGIRASVISRLALLRLHACLPLSRGTSACMAASV